MKQLLPILLLFLLALPLAAQQPMLVKDINPGAEDARPTRMFDFDGRLIFRADSADVGVEPWITDGTADGTYLLGDLNPGDTVARGNSNPDNFTLYKGKVYFKARDASLNSELFVTDGTAAGTMLVKDINPGDENGNPFDFLVYNDSLYFTANGGDPASSELWVTDGTEAGTRMVVDINPGGPGNPINKTLFGDRFVFTGNDGTTGSELWISDGTAAGTMLVKDIRPDGNALPRNYFEWNGELYFSASDGTTGNELWKSDGTADGTVLVKDIDPDGNGAPGDFFVLGDLLFFVADDGTAEELWVTDGTTDGTNKFSTLAVAPVVDPENFTTVVEGRLVVFTATSAAIGEELFTLAVVGSGDAQTYALLPVGDINPGPADSSPEDLVYTGSQIYFSAENAALGRELYRIGVGNLVPELVGEVVAGSGSSEIDEITLAGDQLYFEAEIDTLGSELFTLDADVARLALSANGESVEMVDTFDFGDVEATIGSEDTIFFTIANAGTAAGLVFPNFTTGLSSDAFVMADVSGDSDSIVPMASYVFSVVLDADAVGTYTDSMTVTLSTAEGPDTYRLFFTAEVVDTPPAFMVSANASDIADDGTLDFGEVEPGMDSTIMVFLVNSGSSLLTVDSVGIADTTDFKLDSVGTSLILSPGDTLPLAVTFTPSMIGDFSTTLTVSSVVGDSLFTINLVGSSTSTSVVDLGLGGATAFPNPTASVLTVELEQPLRSGNYRLFDLSGKQVADGRWPSGARRHDLSLVNLPTGIYQLEITDGGRRLLVKVAKQ